MPTGLLVIVALLVLMWLLLVRPQRRRQAQQQRMMENLRVGEEILTAGGLYGHVEAIEEDRVFLEIAPGTTVRVSRRAVAAVVTEEETELEELEPAEVDELEEEASSEGARR